MDKQVGAESVTLTRVTVISAMCMGNLLTSDHLQSKAVNPSNFLASYPKAMSMSCFGGCVPKTESWLNSDDVDLLLDGLAYHQLLFDQVINRGKKGHKSSKDQIKAFISVQVVSDLYSEESRVTTTCGSIHTYISTLFLLI